LPVLSIAVLVGGVGPPPPPQLVPAAAFKGANL
jgi:hypothetical protein